MGSPQFLKHLFVIMSLLLIYSHTTAGEEPAIGYHGEERDALYALKAVFNNSFLTKNWTGLQCCMNNTPIFYGIQCLNGRVTGILLEGMGMTGKVKSDAFVNLTELSILSFKTNSISGNVMDFSFNQKLKYIDLSDNKFYGQISGSLLRLNLLESLQLQNNNLTGPIPEFNQPSLREFNVSYNNLSGAIPTTKVLQSFNFTASYIGNAELCGPPSPTTCKFTSNNPGNTTTTNHVSNMDGGSNFMTHFANLFMVFDVIGLVVVVLLFLLYYKKSRKLKMMMKVRENIVKEEENGEKTIQAPEERKVVAASEGKGKLIFMEQQGGFELGDLLKAPAEGLGKGNFGNCYKAMLDNMPAVVVKRLRDLKPLSAEEYEKQLRVIAEQKHPNLLPLLAYYYSNDEKLVVYKYAKHGNLFNRIHGRKGNDRMPFRWSSRLSVARGVARALEYLHLNAKSQTIIPHGNLKSSNVLLDENDMVLVSDYSLTSLIALPIAAQRMISYKSPEYQNARKISKKSDVWSYGCLLLELLTGKIPSHSSAPGVNGVDLCSWVHRAVREEWTAEIFDVEISVQRSAALGMLKLLQIAIQCCDKSPEKRPEMTLVVREVENIKANIDSDEDDLSFDRSLTDDSLTTTTSVINGI